MYSEELSLAVQPQSTSKIATVEDLAQLLSFGFRGEALASMATVAAVTLASRVAEEKIGSQLTVTQGKLGAVTQVGMSPGTSVTVTKLFEATPARKKFLKSEATEQKKILSVVVPLILVHPEVAFSLIHNTKTVIDVPAQTPEERIAAVLRLHSGVLFPFEYSDQHYTVAGFLGAPQLANKGSHRQFLFINGRPTHRSDLAKVVKDAYGTLLEPRSFPVFILYLTLPQEMVDVNVNPKKDTVTFYNETAVRTLVQQAVVEVLEREDLHYTSHGQGFEALLRTKTMEPVTASVLRSDIDPWTVKDFSLDDSAEILQVHNLYLIAQTSHGIVIIDQHAAHERILYQQFLEAFEAKKSQLVTKVRPQVTVTLSTEEFAALSEKQAILQEMGFLLQFLGDAIKVKAVPTLFSGRNFTELFSEFAADLLSDREISELDSTTHRTLAFLACRTAIKAGEPLAQDERRRLLEKLFSTKTQFTCPHGRPVYIDLEMHDLHKLFKRIL